MPCHPEHPTLNLAQAVLILAYELRISSEVRDGGEALLSGDDREPLANAAEIEALEKQLSEILHRIGYDHEPIHAGLLRDLRRLAVRAAPSSWEARVLRRLCNRASKTLGVIESTGLKAG